MLLTVNSALFLDQSSSVTGFAVVKNGQLEHHGVIRSTSAHPIDRIREIKRKVSQLIRYYRSEYVVMEEVKFFRQKSGGTAEIMSGVAYAIREAARSTLALPIPVYRAAPSSVKSLVTGNGRADKESVARYACQFWQIDPESLKTLDESDALALAVYWMYKGEALMREQSKKKGEI